ncbi:MAG: hypothetical protein H8K03_02905 [Nitrospira sp.]
MTEHRRSTMMVILGGLAAIALVTPSPSTASSKNEKKSPPHSVSSAAETSVSSGASHSDLRPGPAWKTIGGTVKNIAGDVYTVEDYEGNRVQLYVSHETKQLRGHKKVGDPVRAEITQSGFANSIQ